MYKNTLLKIKEIYDMLEDEQSRDIYLNRLNFLITGDYKYIHYIIEKYTPEIMTLNQEKIPGLLKSLPEDKPIILYGAGEDAMANFHYFRQDQRVRGFCDRDIEKQKSGCVGYPVISPEKLLDDKEANIVISTHRGRKEIKEFLKANGVPDSRVHEMSPYMFYVDTEQYFNPDFMYFEEEEVFIDAGSCNLDTSKKFVQYAKKVKRIYAFEPDSDNYKECLQNSKCFENNILEVIPYGTWSEKKVLCFNATSNSDSHITEFGEDQINVITIDEAVRGSDKVTFIKMDVEGAELESLKGAKQTIQKDRPKLAICIYHKAEDMLEIPLYIKLLVPEYKLYVRHHSNGAGETVLYAMP